ncbi:NAD(P)/FAD-dependent oxidoreductase [Pontibacillus salicampi]|uniref:NAD(P)/FAD-dependent oxidoreductase n=1 Tax=Pontibacillus salicampi TaxID=1449801 RepID=A0ABV6LPA5_9BACI
MEETEVTIIGAGIAGVMAAKTLQQHGINHIRIVDKGRSVGGRMATRRIQNGQADHGAQFFTVRSKRLDRCVQDWLDKGWVRKWFGERYPRYTSVDGMNHLVKRIADQLPVSLSTKVTKIEERAGGFQLSTEKGDTWKTGALVITAPLPQALKLVESGNAIVNEQVLQALKDVTYDPALVGLVQLQNPTTFPINGYLAEGLGGDVERIVDHQKKGISDLPILSVYMKGSFSLTHFDEPEELVKEKIQQATSETIPWSEVLSFQLKKWRYAETSSVWKEPYVNLHEALPLLVAGEAFLHPSDQAERTRVESAFLSGLAAGEQIRTYFQKT